MRNGSNVNRQIIVKHEAIVSIKHYPVKKVQKRDLFTKLFGAIPSLAVQKCVAFRDGYVENFGKLAFVRKEFI